MTAAARSERAPTYPAVPVGVSVITSRLRSVNLERDAHAADLDAIYVGGRAQDIMSRVAAAIEDPARTRAWSLTGPYGSGKSTLALLTEALLGAPGGRREQAEQLLADANPALAERIIIARERSAPGGFLIAPVTARREPLRATLTRAALRCANSRWPRGRPPRRVATSLKALGASGAGSSECLNALEALCVEGPLLLVIDEFGKTLEHIAGHPNAEDAEDDVFLLQEIVEAAAGKMGLPLFTLTLQHLSFHDYASRSSSLQRREWAKIQGRFEDITYSPGLGDAVQLITHCLSHGDVPAPGRELIRQHAAAAIEAWSQQGLDGILPGSAPLFEALYPLHPLTAVTAPLLAAQIGQHDRTLTGFLASDEPDTVARFLADNATESASRAATVRLSLLYDYFLASGRTTMLASANSGRWMEIDLILSQAHGLDDQDVQILKTVGILNLIDASGALRASPGILLFALSDPTDDRDDVARKSLLDRLDTLVERGFLVYREFSDEYRIWQGTDVDLRARISDIRERCDDHAVVKMLANHLPGAIVAGRHSQVTGMLRHFVTVTTDAGTGTVQGPAVSDAADGLLIFHFGTAADLPEVDSPLPVVGGTSGNARAVLETGRDLLALEELRADATLDAVARREVTERAAQARAELALAMAAAFAPAEPASRWHLLGAAPHEDPGRPGAVGDSTLTGQSLAAIVSAACERAYPSTPHIRNEMLGRHQLTSQGAKARRELLTAMLTFPDSPRLGIEGYGPERAMYEGVVAYLGLHREYADVAPAGQPDRFRFAEPDRACTAYPAWEALLTALHQSANGRPVNEVFDLLMAPPYGVKAGVVPVIVIAALILTSHEVALFEEGTYQPALTSDLAERLVKTPGRYSLKYVPVAEGQRHLVVEKLATWLGITRPSSHAGPERNPALLAITRALLDRVRDLSSYARRTRRLSDHAAAVRDTLVTARDPDDLVFAALPRALGLDAIIPSTMCDETTAAEYANALGAAVKEIQTADCALRDEAVAALSREFHLPADLPALRNALADRVSTFAGTVVEPELRGLLSVALNTSLVGDDWLDPIAVRLVQAGLANWTDEHPASFAAACRRVARALDRLAHLHWDEEQAGRRAAADLRLVTLTAPDGNEERVLAPIPRAARRTVATLARTAIDNARDQLGPGGGRMLLAAIAEAITAEQTADEPSRDSAPPSA